MTSLKNILACPVCHGSLTAQEKGYTCNNCTLDFPISGQVPCFIHEHLYPSVELYAQAKAVIDYWGLGWAKRLKEPEHSYLFADNNRPQLEQYVQKAVASAKEFGHLFGVDLDLQALKGQKILNIGCGCGGESLTLSYYGADCLGMDITRQAANAAQTLMQKLKSKGLGLQADARFIPLLSDSLDKVYSFGVLHHSENIQQSVNEIRRVLKPGGQAYIMLYATFSWQFMQQRILGMLRGYFSFSKQQQYMNQESEAAWRTENRKNPCTQTFSVAEVRKLFRDFTRVSVRKAGFSLSQLILIKKLIPGEVLDRFSRRYLSFLDNLLGPGLMIVAEK
jgi:ubiquinone/menaquinone biosynthesis C-methylase UbiE/uncharacterized protein YbaR (Trm112 family)